MPRSSTKGGFPAAPVAKPVAPVPVVPPVPAVPAPRPGKAPLQDLEIKDASLIFNTVWSELEQEFGHEHMRFPKEIFWLNGAPGAGKGTHTRFILKYRGYPQQPVVVSDLLQSPEARKRINAGLLVGDREVTALVLRALLNPIYENGTVVDGYPRTEVQVECLKLFYQKLMAMRNEFRDTALAQIFRKPRFHILVLYIDEEESVRRQLRRGRQAIEHNQSVRESGEGHEFEVRPTDLTEEAARNRYRVFKERTYDSLRALREVFYYHYINGTGTVEEIQQRVLKELQYQSSLELEEETYDFIADIPVATEIVQHARQDLVTRLDDYAKKRPDLFKRVAELVRVKFMPIVLRHAISGESCINTEDSVFEDVDALGMLIDIFSERGFHAVVDLHRLEIPDSLDPKTYKIKTRWKKVFRVHIRFAGSEIRRGD
ncbi:MAG TPA: nucleoside monophosphate kinase [Opitutales bacterium]|nr:nucleoside monophosphate kinase [Opitutales bacterium]